MTPTSSIRSCHVPPDPPEVFLSGNRIDLRQTWPAPGVKGRPGQGGLPPLKKKSGPGRPSMPVIQTLPGWRDRFPSEHDGGGKGGRHERGEHQVRDRRIDMEAGMNENQFESRAAAR